MMKKLLHYIIFFFNSLILLSLFSSLLSPFVNPNTFWPISFFGLFFPIIFCLCIFFSIYWFFYNKKYFLVNLVLILISIPYGSRYIAVNLEESTKEGINVMSYNVRLFNKWKWINEDGIKEKTVQFINKQNLDILCIQEYYNPGKNLKLDFKFSHIGLQKRKEDWHMAIYSKYPQIHKQPVNIDGARMNNSCIFSDIVIEKDTIRVYNIHLASNFFQRRDLDYIISIEKEKVKNGIVGIGKKLKYSFERRGREVDQIKKHMDSSPYPIIICGDFNDTPVSYAYQKLGENKKDAFLESGNGIGASFNKIPTLRIDYILIDEELKSSSFSTHQEKFSDHRAISSTIKLN